MDEFAVAGPYALIGFYSENAGVTALVEQNASGTWVLLTRGGGQLNPEAMLTYAPNMPSADASNLYALAVSQDQ